MQFHSSSEPRLAFIKLQEIARGLGLEILGVCRPEISENARNRLIDWQNAGFAGEMAYMNRGADLLAQPEKLLPNARSIVVLAFSYEAAPRRVLPRGHGRVARYAMGQDYHKILPLKLKELVSAVERECGKIEARVFSDAVPLLERDIGKSSGLGFIGKNTMLIRPGLGSFFFIAEVLWNVLIEIENALPVNKDSCKSCTRCLDACPTQAFVKEGVLDARRCISYLSIEKRGMLDLWEREALGDWIFGCDICQEVCPFNHASLKQERPAALVALGAKSGAGQSLSIAEMFKIVKPQDFKARFKDTALSRAGREGILRNAACVAANTGWIEGVPILCEAVRGDVSPIVRATALWAISKLQNLCETNERNRCAVVRHAALQDPDDIVKNEALRARELYE